MAGELIDPERLSETEPKPVPPVRVIGTCAECAFFQRQDEYDECRRHPPRSVFPQRIGLGQWADGEFLFEQGGAICGADDDPSEIANVPIGGYIMTISGGFNRTWSSDWCGEFVPRGSIVTPDHDPRAADV